MSTNVLSVRANGKFSVGQKQKDSYSCGADEILDYKFQVTIKARAGALTPEGFLLDHRDIKRYFHDQYDRNGLRGRTVPSGEVLVHEAMTHFKDLLAEKNPRADLISVEVLVSGTDDTSIMAECVA